MIYNSFYGGRKGTPFTLAHSFESVAKMAEAFQQGTAYTEVNFDEYVYINNPENPEEHGSIYRRGYNFLGANGGAILVGKFKGETGNGIDSIVLADSNSSTLIDTYEIHLTDGDKISFSVKNGKGIISIIEDESAYDETTRTRKMVINYSDGTIGEFFVRNGEQGERGISIQKAELDADNNLFFTFTDGVVKPGGKVKTIKGDTGDYVSSMTLEGEDNSLYYTMKSNENDKILLGRINTVPGVGIEQISNSSKDDPINPASRIYTVKYTDGTTSEISVPKMDVSDLIVPITIIGKEDEQTIRDVKRAPVGSTWFVVEGE